MSTWATVGKTKIFGSWMLGNAHVQISQGGAERHSSHRPYYSYRKVEVFEPPKNLDPLWIGVGSVIKVERSGTRANESYQRIGYYLCSLSPQSNRLADGI